MSTEIKNTLFRFVTMRAPELSDEKNITNRFLYRQDKPEGAVRSFDEAVLKKPSLMTKWNAMKVNLATFPALKSDEECKKRFAIYDFAVWLARNRTSYDEGDLLLKVQEFAGTALSSDEVETLWDNTIYQVVTNKNFYTKEVIMQILTADNLLKKIVGFEDDSDVISDLINTKIVLPKALFDEKDIPAPTPSRASARTAAPTIAASTKKVVKEQLPVLTAPSEQMLSIQAISLAERTLEKNNTLKTALAKVEKDYDAEYRAAYKAAEAANQSLTKPILDNYQQEVDASNRAWYSKRDPNTPIDPNNPYDKPPLVLQPDLPKFEFEFKKQIDLNYLQTVLSAEDFDTLANLLQLKAFEVVAPAPTTAKKAAARATAPATLATPVLPTINESFADVNNLIGIDTAQKEQLIIENTPNQAQAVMSFNGVLVPMVNETVVAPFSYEVYSYSVDIGSIINPLIRTVYFTVQIEIPDDTWQVANLNYTIIKRLGKVQEKAYTLTRNHIGNSFFLTNLVGTRYDAYQPIDIIGFEMILNFANGSQKKILIDYGDGLNPGASYKGILLDSTPNVDTSQFNTVENTFIPTGYGVKQLGIADYKKVIQTTQGYIEGEVAHIENIMAREYKERATRKLRRSENTTTTSSETEKEKLSDTTSTGRFEMQSEVANILQESKDFSSGVFAGSTFSAVGADFTLNANVNMATHSSKEESNRQAVTQAKEITERALERVVSKVKQERIEKIIEEFEETNKHGFDNTKGTEHVVGVFRWVDKVYKNQVVNYGKRLMFEFMVPEPAKLHVLGMTESKSFGGLALIPPVDPRTYIDSPNATLKFQLKDYSSINENMLKYWGSKFNAKLNPSPALTQIVGKTLTYDSTTTKTAASGKDTIEIPENYYAFAAKVTLTGSAPGDSQGWGRGGAVIVGDHTNSWYLEGGKDIISDPYFVSISKYYGTIPISFFTTNHHALEASVAVMCQLTDEYLIQWKQETFKAIIDAYEVALAKYNQAIAEEGVKGNLIKESNPGFYRQIENMVLRKNCISYIIDKGEKATKTYGRNMSNDTDANLKKSFLNYEINTTAALDEYTSFVKFIEQAFEWDIMSYNFYPYYWGSRQSWSQLYLFDNNDPLFRAFMQSGMARVIVTVRPGFEEAVRFYMQTGQIWNGGEVPVIDDKLFLSIVDELRQPEGQKEGKAWHTRLPTALTILQAGSIGLTVQKALPYDDDLSDYEDPASVPRPEGFSLNGGIAPTSPLPTPVVSPNYIAFTHQYIDTNTYKTVGAMSKLFPRKFECQGEEIVIAKEVAWKAKDSAAIVYQKLAEKITLLTGVEAKQVTAANANPCGIKFTIDTSVVKEFRFVKFPVSGANDINNVVYVDLTSEFFRIDSPIKALDRFVDAKSVALKDAEANILLPINRFKV
jgi:hypothetical protein